MRTIPAILFLLTLSAPLYAFGDCLHDGKVEGEGGVIKFEDDVFRQCQDSKWVRVIAEVSKIQIISSNYGVDTPPVSCDPTGHLRSVCDGKDECAFPVQNGPMCGKDVYPGPAKRLNLTWRCGEKPATSLTVKERPSGPDFSLTCK